MNDIIGEIDRAVSAAESRAAAAATGAEIEAIRIDYLGRNGLFPALSRRMGEIPADQRKATGGAFNTGRTRIQEAIEAAQKRLSAGSEKMDSIDLSLPGRRSTAGRIHPISRMADECAEVFRRMGFVAVDGPEIEDIYHNFDALNTPMDHPSRDPQDTFYFPDGRILRSQTSPVQIRVMETHTPPVRIVAPGRVFRRDTPDATHGMTLAAVTLPYFRHILPYGLPKFKRFATQVWGISPEGKTDEQTALDGLDALKAWMQEIGLVLSLRELGATPEMLDGIAEGTFLLRGGYAKDLTTADVRRILENSL